MAEQPETNIESIIETEDNFFYVANEPDARLPTTCNSIMSLCTSSQKNGKQLWIFSQRS